MKASYEKFSAILKSIKNKDPDVIFLQEITDISLTQLRKELDEENHQIVTDEKQYPYFTVTVLNKKTTTLKTTRIFRFTKSQMGRNLLVTEVVWNSHTLHLINAHLESTHALSTERKRQTQSLFRTMQDLEESGPVIFAGDTNLRDYEVKQIGGLPNGIQDVWEVLGKPANTAITWSNERFDICEYEPTSKSRFDRVFFLGNKAKTITPKNMVPLGVQKLPSGLYPSDHIGLCVSFQISKIPKKKTKEEQEQIEKQAKYSPNPFEAYWALGSN